jgi:predicted DNA-binding protein with PD1-like motif
MDSIRFQSIESKVTRVISGRLLPGTELIGGIQSMCMDNGLKCGVVVCGIGSLANARLTYAVNRGEIGIKYSDPITISGPFELLSCQGIIGHTSSGEFSIHLHGIISDSDMKLYGGHFTEGCKVLATVEIGIMELPYADLLREYDEETGFLLFKFYQKK